MPSDAPRLLAIDSSTDTLSVALGSGAPDALPLVFAGPGAAQSSASLLPAVQSLLAQAGWALDSLDAVVFGRGPGSFTGLRTACAVAQGLAYGAGGLPVLPVDTLMALAEAARAQRGGQGLAVPPVIAALLDARMNEIYVALYACGPDGLSAQPLRAPCLCAPPLLAVWLAESLPPGLSLENGDCLLAGNVFEVYGDALQALPGPRQPALPTAAALLSLAPGLLAAGRAVDAREALPLYVRDKVARTTAEREA